MPDKNSHLNKAQHNENLLASLISSPSFAVYSDWVVTAAFYTTLHYVDAYLARYNIHPAGHSGQKGRNACVSQYLKNVASKYQTLYNKSRYARYVPYSEQNISAAEVKTLVGWIAQYFRPLP